MTESPTSSSSVVTGRGLDRRQLLKAGAWAAPVVLVATAAPAHAASTGAVPAGYLVVSSYDLSDINQAPPAFGPLKWAGGQIQYQGPYDASATATVGYTIQLIGPGDAVLRARTGTVILDLYSGAEAAEIPNADFVWGDDADELLTAGDYFVRVTGYGNDGSKSDESNIVRF